ncbi:MAG: 3-phosphoshikimate 1-carboxyvinyltransferase [Candidatus Planktophila sp.]|nr:3-phosphoshikimate 1-carboxyvinyltransferase [Candidatus Planktophila sp.]
MNLNDAHWPAIFRGTKPVDISVVIPGSKSVTNRALILAAQANSPSTLRRPLVSRDSELMVQGLQALGIGIVEQDGIVNGLPEYQLTLTPAAMSGPARIDVGNAGTVMRFLPPLAALATGEISFDGDSRSHERPLAPLIKALEHIGVSIEHEGRYGLPLTLHGTGAVRGGEVTIDASASSQFLSALLLVAPSFTDGITVTHKGDKLPSMPHIEMSVAMLRGFGATVVVNEDANSWRVLPGALHGCELVVEPDLSNAAPFLSIAMLCGGSITIADWPEETTQPGDQLRSILSRMGAQISMNDAGLTLTGTGIIHGIDIDLHDVGELTPSIAALAVFADSPSHLRGIGHLRSHETDRLSALTREINSLGGNVEEHKDSLHITPAPLHGGVFHTYDDHRLATAGAVIGLVVPGIEVENIATTGKTLPDFPGLWKSLLD